jgi:RNA polymerase sigma factor (sigma-70 family)
MTARQGHLLLRFLRRIAAPDRAGETPDAQLLARFVGRRDEAAFAELVRRHGPVVFGVCRRLLGDTPDAEDAFQAAFLVLARRARAVSRPELLGNWLYGVAYRTALKARADAARRRVRERQVRAVDVTDPADEAARRELRQVLDDELSRLPERYRAPLVLCYLEGQTQEEAARRLGCPRKTVTTRLARACARLRGRLTRRGLALPGGAVAAALAREAPAAVPAALVDATTRAAALFAAGEAVAAGGVPAKAAALAKGVSNAMFVTKLKTWGFVLLAAAVIGVAAGVLAHRPLAAEPPGPKPEGQPQPAARAADQPKEAERKTDQGKLQGSWAIVTAEAGGHKASEDEVKKIGLALDFAGDKVRLEQGDGSEVATFRLDPTKDPKAIDLILGKTEVHRGIYRLDGDRLTICKSHPPGERPTEFATKADSKFPMLLVFKRSGEPDQAKLQGTWTITAVEVGGKPSEGLKGGRVVFAGDRMTVEKAGKEAQEATFTLDPFASPKAIDGTPLNGPNKGATFPGIYALEGDTLKLCLALEERRPTEFAAQPGRKMTLLVLKREK